MQKLLKILLEALPIIAMIALIPVISNDYLLTGVYILITVVMLAFKRNRNDITALIFGIIGLTISEAFFVSTGVETFTRNSLFGLMPLWLPFLWGYAFVVIKRAIKILD